MSRRNLIDFPTKYGPATRGAVPGWRRFHQDGSERGDGGAYRAAIRRRREARVVMQRTSRKVNRWQGVAPGDHKRQRGALCPPSKWGRAR